jgi:hypothetical protein
VSNKETPTFDLWLLAARYQFIELEDYCRSNDAVFKGIKEVLCDPKRGLEHMVRMQEIPLSLMTKVVIEFVQRKHERRCVCCERMTPLKWHVCCSHCGNQLPDEN